MKKKKHSKSFPSKLVSETKPREVLKDVLVDTHSENKLLGEIYQNSERLEHDIIDEKYDSLEKPNYLVETLTQGISFEQTNLQFVEESSLQKEKNEKKDFVANTVVESKTPSSMIDISESMTKIFIENITELYNLRLEFMKTAFKI